ncbi:class I SAM-dependent methyltransferase [Streptomyces sp. PTM05]|uniref:Class I SAM-dependent methyltransferase n=1 Tax=Streptantibioticus parmotrematis TaxID=2873249 RepID=A0ABS7QQB9_9ACTN|nr:class I SAM-dependent methyltransferase [Streptantibioticus parmotrematis]MBY8885370.1 class I SAM-dependent methyltransferase [Streptantibioticus parmotrematis]
MTIDSPVSAYGRAAARLFDQLGKVYEDTYGQLPEQLAAIHWLLDRLPPQAKVLDIGSGTGRPTAQLLADAGHRVTGCDVSHTMVTLARTGVPQARFAWVDVRDLPEAPGTWDAITAFFPLLQMSRAEIVDTLGRIGRWLVPGGLFVMSTVPFDAEHAELTWMGHTSRASSFAAEVYPRLVRDAGLSILRQHESVFHPDYPGMGAEQHLFIFATKPGDPSRAAPAAVPSHHRGPLEPNARHWAAMEARFDRQDVPLIVDSLSVNTRVLALGGRTVAVARDLADRLGTADAGPDGLQEEDDGRMLGALGVTLLPGAADRLPPVDRSFDAVVAAWTLQRTDEPDFAVAEMARVVDPGHPEAKVVLVQDAPDNEIIGLWNGVRAPLTGAPADPQGQLLLRAAHVLSAHGFDDIAVTRLPIDVVFPEAGPEARARAAARALTALWNVGHPQPVQLHHALLSALRGHFCAGTDRITNDAVMLLARPRR